MERLTEQIKNKETGEILAYRLHTEVYRIRAYRKLGELEDLEEKGLLLRLPCKVGDRVYKIWNCGKNGKSVAEFEVKHIDIDFLPEIEFSFMKTKNKTGVYWFCKSSIGKTVFLTREEAEKALAEMEE